MVVVLIVTSETDVPLLLKIIGEVNGETAKINTALAGLKTNNDRAEADIANAQV